MERLTSPLLQHEDLTGVILLEVMCFTTVGPEASQKEVTSFGKLWDTWPAPPRPSCKLPFLLNPGFLTLC